MAYRITIDPGHGGRDPGAVFEGRRESDDNLDLALAVGEILAENGVEVEYTRTTDVYNTPFEKAMMANNAGSDFFISFHRNSSVTPGQSGAEVLVYDNQGKKAEVAEAILENLAEVGFGNRGVTERPNLVVLRRTKMPAIMLETGFINSDSDNAIFDQEFYEVARAIADGVLDELDLREEEDWVPDSPLYRVQVGAFRNQESAKNLVTQLMEEGYPAVMVTDGNLYKVQVGAYQNLDYAVMMEQHLKNNGYFTWIVSA